MAEGRIPRPLRIYQAIRALDLPALLVGGLAAAAGQRWGGYVLVVNVTVQVGSHVTVGGWSYRDVMARPWPHVAPGDDDEWDE